MAGYNNYGSGINNGFGYGNTFGNRSNQNGTFGLSPDQIVQYFKQGYLTWTDYVHGKAGADVYQLPPGVNAAILWDNENDRYYIKKYDDNGIPRVVADNDFTPHVEPEPQMAANIDLSAYATKDDIKAMIADAFNNINIQPNLTGYVTVQQFDQALNNLSVGNGGRIVRNNESNA